MNKAAIQTKLTCYITENFLYDDPDFKLTNDFPLFEERVIDSMGIFRLVTYMNESFGVVVQPDEIVIENFGTIDNMATLVETHLQNGTELQSDFAAFA